LPKGAVHKPGPLAKRGASAGILDKRIAAAAKPAPSTKDLWWKKTAGKIWEAVAGKGPNKITPKIYGWKLLVGGVGCNEVFKGMWVVCI